MALKAQTIRIQAPIPRKDVVGIETPNKEVETIYLRDILEDDIFKKSKSSLTVALGKDIVGKPFVTDLKKLPHLLIAGITSSGKSVGINAMILSLLYKKFSRSVTFNDDRSKDAGVFYRKISTNGSCKWNSSNCSNSKTKY